MKDSLFDTIRRNVYTTIGGIDTILSNQNRIIVLCYHGVADDGWRHSVTFETLKKQIDIVMRSYAPITLYDIEEYVYGRKQIMKPSFAVTFDDGYEDLLQTKEFFAEQNIHPTVFLLSDLKHADRAELDNKKPFLNDRQVRELIGAGWSIGSHSATHRNFAQLSTARLHLELTQSRTMLEKKFGTQIKHFAYPKGVHSPEIVDAVAAAGYTLAMSMDDALITPETHPLLIPRIGVNNSHTLSEFKILGSPSVVEVRRQVKKFFSTL